MEKGNTRDKDVQPDPSDPLMVYMHKIGIPLTRENYLDLAYYGSVPKTLSAEEEAQLPKAFRKEE